MLQPQGVLTAIWTELLTVLTCAPMKVGWLKPTVAHPSRKVTGMVMAFLMRKTPVPRNRVHG